MTANIHLLTYHVRQQAIARARRQVIVALTEIYQRVESYDYTKTNPISYKYLGIDCRLLELDEDGKHLDVTNSDPCDPVFFEPRGVAWVAPVHATDSECETELETITELWEGIEKDPCVRDTMPQARYMTIGPKQMGFRFRPLRDGKGLPIIRVMPKWVHLGTAVPTAIAEKFWSAIRGSMGGLLPDTFVPKELICNPELAPPHTLIGIVLGGKPSERLFRAEVITLTAVMITRLEGEKCLDYNTIPVMAITFFERMKARVIEAHSSQQGLVIKKTKLLDFSTNKIANRNMDILLGFVAANQVGDPRGPWDPINIPKGCTIDAMGIGNR